MRTISTRHAERVLAVKLDKPAEIPPFFFEMFDEGDNNQMLMSSLTPHDNVSPLLSPYLGSPTPSGIFSPIGIHKVPSLGELQTMSSPLLRTPNLLTTVTPFWTNPTFAFGSLPSTPKTPYSVDTLEAMVRDDSVSSSVQNLD